MRTAAVLVALAGCGRIGFDTSARDGDGGTGDGRGDGAQGDHPTIPSNVMFVTPATLTPGGFGGLAAADASCQMLAMQAGLPGTYVAYLSTSTVDAISRLGSARGWSRPDGMPLVDTASDLAAGRLYVSPSIEPDGTRASGPTRVVTGTNRDGTRGTLTCMDYTSTAPATTVEDGRLTASGTSFAASSTAAACGANERIYCFGVDRALAVPAPSFAGSVRRAFVSAPWSPGGGLASADTRCQNDAMTAGLGGTFRAALAGSTTSGASRLTAGLPWARLDGVLLAPTDADVIAGNLVEPLNLTFDHQYVDQTFAWSGGSSFTQATNAVTCNDWTSSIMNQMGVYGTVVDTGMPWFYAGTQACNTSARLYCFEQ